MTIRGFEVVSRYQDAQVNLPKRATQQAAGYDFEASEDITLPSVLSNPFFRGLNIFSLGKLKNVSDNEDLQQLLKPVLVPTGIKAYMQEGEYL
ncbi:MAG: deoxyuridine 5'-triphosphate nucleotidohydrolase, partial [Leuconostoc fallax]